MVSVRRKGFTLIELLTVIAIIAILAGITFSALPGVIERAKLRKLDGVFHGIEVAMATYATRAGSTGYPPAYGFLLASARGKAPNQLQDSDYLTRPYGALIELNKAADIYDNWAESGDANRNGGLEMQEFSPIGQLDVSSGRSTFYGTLYRGNNLPDEVDEQLKAKTAPIIYAPVNLAQFKRARTYWLKERQDPLATTWDVNSPSLQGMAFPPPKYDAYVLLSVGPGGEDFGLLSEGNQYPQGAPAAYFYHIAALRTFFLATRDLDGDGVLDFNYDPGNAERKLEYTVNIPGVPSFPANNLLPSSTKPAGFGPCIFPREPVRIK